MATASNQYRPPQQQPHSIPADLPPTSRVIHAPMRRELVPGAVPQRPMPASRLRHSSSAEDMVDQAAAVVAARRQLFASPLLRDNANDNEQIKDIE